MSWRDKLKDVEEPSDKQDDPQPLPCKDCGHLGAESPCSGCGRYKW